MTDLEFINKQIETEQSIIKSYEEFFKTDKTEFDKQITNGYIQIHQKNINHLQQIKAKLEAWEICKNKLNLKVQTEEAITEGFCMKGCWLLVEQYPYTQTTIIEQEEHEILKKALEVEDE